MAHKKKQHASAPLHVRWSFPWSFRALLKDGPPLFISSFISPLLALFCLSPPVLRKRAKQSERSARGGRLSGKRARVISGDNIGCKTIIVARSFTMTNL